MCSCEVETATQYCLKQALVAAYRAPTGDAAYKEIGHMLEKLGDPFTRIMPPGCAPAGVTASHCAEGIGLAFASASHRLCTRLW